MARISFILFCIALLGIYGCASSINCGAPNQQLKTQITALETQLNQLKQENVQLKIQLENQLINKKEIRMPTAFEIQAALKNAGFYKDAIDGQIGIQTKEAIKKFQEANKIDPDGVVGSRTWQLLSRYLEDSEISP